MKSKRFLLLSHEFQLDDDRTVAGSLRTMHCLSSNLVSNLRLAKLYPANDTICTYKRRQTQTDCYQKLHRLPSIVLSS